MTATATKTGGTAKPTGPRGRAIRHRVRVRAWLKLLTPLHVGGLAHDPGVDLTVAVDGQSRLYVPGTSLAGALREWCGRAPEFQPYDPEDPRTVGKLERAWGYVPRKPRKARKASDDGGQASRIVVRDGLLTTAPTDMDKLLSADVGTLLPADAVEVRTGVGIDRVLGTAAHGFLYDRAVVPRGAYLSLEIDLESPYRKLEHDPAMQMLSGLLEVLRERRVRLGAGRTRGLGRVELAAEPDIVVQHFSGADGLLAAVGFPPPGAGQGVPEARNGARLPDGSDLDLAAQMLTITVTWKPKAPVMVRSGMDGFAVASMPLVSAVGKKQECGETAESNANSNANANAGGDPGENATAAVARQASAEAGDPWVALVLPGSSIKGALRAHAERIERTVRELDAPFAADGDEGKRSACFREQLAQLPAVNVLFGSAPKPRKAEGSPPEQDPLRWFDGAGPWGVGALSVDDCYAVDPIPAGRWQSLYRGTAPSGESAGTPRTGVGSGAGRRSGDGDLSGRGDRSSAGGRAPAGDPAGRDSRRDDTRVGERAQISGELRELLAAHGIDQADHVAIDRWTGGAAPKRLYSTLEPHGVGWNAIEITVDLARLARFQATQPDNKQEPPETHEGAATAATAELPNLPDATLALLLLVLRDVDAGRVQLGHATNRGHGDIEVEKITLTGFPGIETGREAPRLKELLATSRVAELAERWRYYIQWKPEASAVKKPAETRKTGGAV